MWPAWCTLQDALHLAGSVSYLLLAAFDMISSSVASLVSFYVLGSQVFSVSVANRPPGETPQ